jgi:Flp pilus assembly protein TadG
MRAADRRRAPRQRGLAAVELAMVLPVLVLLLMFPLYLGRVFWHYTVIQHAAQDAARYLSRVPVSEITNTTRVASVAAVAQTIVAEEMADLAPGSVAPNVEVKCGAGNCTGFTKPSTVRVFIELQIEDIFFSVYTYPLTLSADVTYPYQGN